LPPRLTVHLDYPLRRWRSFEPYGGPLNNQRRKQEAILQLIAAYRPDRIVETGTFRGSTTAYLARHFDGPIESVEINPHFYFFARRRLKRLHRVTLVLSDSVQFLKTLTGRSGSAGERTLFYLDAHWWDRWVPIKEELIVIFGHWRSAIAVIDDFAVPGDPSYECIDYEPGRP